jgi:hypothetical protein
MYSIFHTSFCGSTLLACHLSKSIPTLTEPSWSHKAREIGDLWEKVDFVKNNHPKNTLVKYSSLMCDVIPHIEGKKVFLYNNFEDHLRKLSTVISAKDLNMHYEGMEWAKRFTWATIANDVMYVQSKFLLEDTHDACQEICNHFEIEYKPVEIDFHVKKAGYNHRDEPIKI